MTEADGSSSVESTITRLAREESGRVLALLARRHDDIDLADEAVQDALTEAARTWHAAGIPTNPPAWLHAVARRKAIDRLRRSASAQRRLLAAAPELLSTTDAEPVGGALLIEDDVDGGGVGDEHLRLVLLCCHPALDPDTQVALTLRLVGGLTTTEIAAAFLLPESTLAQRVVRAKRKIRDAGIPLAMPAALDDRIAALLGVLYLIFNEGYLSRGDRGDLVRVDLAEEAIRLTSLIDTLVPGRAEIEGLLALQLYHRARLSTRTDDVGELLLLEQQDRSRWDLPMIERANGLVRQAIERLQPGPYQLQALIAGYHANARTAADTDWPTIAALYKQLSAIAPSPVVALNHAVAVAIADGPHAGLALLDCISGLDDYHLYHAAQAELLARAGDASRASASFERASELAQNPVERRHLQRRAAAIRSGNTGREGHAT